MESFCLYANCEVVYNGRASSVLGPGNFLIIFKDDRSLLIHGGSLNVPCNYLGPGSTYTVDNNRILFKKNAETINVIIHEEIWKNQIHNWSKERPKISRTEKELREKLIANWSNLIGFEPQKVILEHLTDLGPIDLLIIDNAGNSHVVEVKRKKANSGAVSQLLKYKTR